jgi:PAS domain S-box-containing protein
MTAVTNPKAPDSSPELQIAVVGGGRRCLSLLEVLETTKTKGLKAQIIGVADINPDAAGFRYAKEAGIFTTHDFSQLFDLPRVDLVINLTGNQGIFPDLTSFAPEGTPILPYPASVLFQEIVQDVLSASRRVAEQADEISRTRSFVKAVAQATIVGVMVIDTNYKIQWINKAGAKIAGLTGQEALGRYCFQVSHQLVSPCDSPKTPCPMKETLETGRAAHAIHQHRIMGGEFTYCDVTTFPLFNKKGEVVEVVEFIRDITADLNHEVERRTRDIKKDLARLVQEDKLIALGKMVASAAHEINNPISSIINFTQLVRNTLREGSLDSEQTALFAKYMDLCLREARRCGKIVTNLLSFSRQRNVEPKMIDMSAMLDDIITLTSHKIELSNIELIKRIRDEHFSIWGDYTQIQQCLINLIFNAIEAMPDGGRLMVRGGLDGEQAWLEVSDTGVGIASEHLPNIFEPFFTTKNEGYGVGLGLSMVYGIIREHHGSISVESRQGQGTTFRITLPAAPDDQSGLNPGTPE